MFDLYPRGAPLAASRAGAGLLFLSTSPNSPTLSKLLAFSKQLWKYVRHGFQWWYSSYAEVLKAQRYRCRHPRWSAGSILFHFKLLQVLEALSIFASFGDCTQAKASFVPDSNSKMRSSWSTFPISISLEEASRPPLTVLKLDMSDRLASPHYGNADEKYLSDTTGVVFSKLPLATNDLATRIPVLEHNEPLLYPPISSASGSSFVPTDSDGWPAWLGVTKSKTRSTQRDPVGVALYLVALALINLAIFALAWSYNHVHVLFLDDTQSTFNALIGIVATIAGTISSAALIRSLSKLVAHRFISHGTPLRTIVHVGDAINGKLRRSSGPLVLLIGGVVLLVAGGVQAAFVAALIPVRIEYNKTVNIWDRYQSSDPVAISPAAAVATSLTSPVSFTTKNFLSTLQRAGVPYQYGTQCKTLGGTPSTSSYKWGWTFTLSANCTDRNAVARILEDCSAYVTFQQAILQLDSEDRCYTTFVPAANRSLKYPLNLTNYFKGSNSSEIGDLAALFGYIDAPIFLMDVVSVFFYNWATAQVNDEYGGGVGAPNPDAFTTKVPDADVGIVDLELTPFDPGMSYVLTTGWSLFSKGGKVFYIIPLALAVFIIALALPISLHSPSFDLSSVSSMTSVIANSPSLHPYFSGASSGDPSFGVTEGPNVYWTRKEGRATFDTSPGERPWGPVH